MNKKTIGLCIGLCAATACITAVASVGYVTSEFRPTTSTTAATVTSNASEAISGTTESATTILLPTTDSTTTIDSATNNTTTPSTTTDSYIGEAKAKEIALAHAGINEADTTGLRCQLDYDDGYYEYEVDWNVGRTEYEYTILATNGTILEFDIDLD